MLAFYLALLDTEEQKDKLEQIYTHYRGLMFHVASSVPVSYTHLDSFSILSPLQPTKTRSNPCKYRSYFN